MWLGPASWSVGLNEGPAAAVQLLSASLLSLTTNSSCKTKEQAHPALPAVGCSLQKIQDRLSMAIAQQVHPHLSLLLTDNVHHVLNGGFCSSSACSRAAVLKKGRFSIDCSTQLCTELSSALTADQG